MSARCVLGVGGRGEQGARKESEGGVSCGVTFLCGVFFDGDNNVFSFGKWAVAGEGLLVNVVLFLCAYPSLFSLYTSSSNRRWCR